MRQFINLALLITLALFLFEFVRFILHERKIKDLAWRRAARVFVRLLAFAVVIFPLMFPLATSIGPLPTGPDYPGVAELVLTDTTRPDPYANDGSARWLPIMIWYPSGSDHAPHTCPLILFSHGSFGIKESNATLCQDLASYGYVVCAIDHTHQSLSA
ncbi:MAG TPA: hypothetical protein PKE04_20945, partial [Clostridia bacterium]|nr:hypothetical protein [Clostridia bacterium]